MQGTPTKNETMNATAKPTIHHFNLAKTGLSKVNMPEGAVILKMEISSTGVKIFAMVNPTAEMKPRYFQVVATGEELPEWAWDARYHSVPGAAPLHILEVEAGHLKK